MRRGRKEEEREKREKGREKREEGERKRNCSEFRPEKVEVGPVNKFFNTRRGILEFGPGD